LFGVFGADFSNSACTIQPQAANNFSIDPHMVSNLRAIKIFGMRLMVLHLPARQAKSRHVTSNGIE
jgi:hypothetical protein